MTDKNTMKQEADKIFASTDHEVLFGSPAGEFFTSLKLGNLSLKEGEKLSKFERNQEVTDAKVKTLNQGDTIAEILKVENLEDLKPYELDERKGVKAAYTDQLVKLIAAINAVDTVVDEILKVENLEDLKPYELDERKGVKAAYTDQLEKLTAAINAEANANKKIEDEKTNLNPI